MTQNVHKMRSFLCRRCFFRVMFFSDDLVILLELLICYIIRSGAALVSLWPGPEVDEDCGRAGDGGFRYIHCSRYYLLALALCLSTPVFPTPPVPRYLSTPGWRPSPPSTAGSAGARWWGTSGCSPPRTARTASPSPSSR